VSEAQEVKQLREENARLKKLLADLSLDKDMLQSVIRKTPSARRSESGSAASAGRVSASERRVCGLMEIPRMSCRYRSWRDDSELHERLLAREPATVNSGAPRVVTRCHSWSVSL
jgi:putative transposase